MDRAKEEYGAMAGRIKTGTMIKLGSMALVVVILGYAIVAKPPGHNQQHPGTVSEIMDPYFVRLAPEEVARLPIATRFDLPMGGEGGALVYNAQGFRINRHLGDDFNGIGGQDSDLGDPVYAVADGEVVYSGTPTPGWGNVVIIAHRVPIERRSTGDEGVQKFRVVQSFYAHIDNVEAVVGFTVNRGEQIATVGPAAAGSSAPHLHFELRESRVIAPGVGYANRRMDRLNPTKFLREYRGAPEDQLNVFPRSQPEVMIAPIGKPDESEEQESETNPDS